MTRGVGRPGGRPPSSGGARVLALTALVTLCACQATSRPGLTPAPTGPRLAIQGLTVQASEGGRISSRLQANQLLILPKRLGPIELGVLEELVITGARLELYAPAAGQTTGWQSATFGLGSSAVFGTRDGPPLAGVTIHGLEVTLAGAAGAESRLTAARGDLDAWKARLVLRDVTIQAIPAGRSLRTPRAIWREGSGDLYVPGAWELREGDRTTRGHGLVANLSLTTVQAPGR